MYGSKPELIIYGFTHHRMDKQALKAALLQSFDEEIQHAIAASRTAQETASHQDNQPENQYDTLALEAAYLAHGQSERILSLQQTRIQLEKWPIKHFDQDSEVGLGAAVTLLSSADITRNLFIAPVGGRTLTLDGKSLLVISVDTPLAKALSGCYLGDEVTLTLDGQVDDWEVIGCY